MGSEVSVCFYLVIGIGVAAAIWIGSDSRSDTGYLFQTLTAPLFWPIYLPVLLTQRNHQNGREILSIAESNSERTRDGMTSMIAQVEGELDAALRSLDGWAENVLGGEQDRIAELKSAWKQQASHIRELDRLFSQSSTEIPATRTESLQSTSPVEAPSPFAPCLHPGAPGVIPNEASSSQRARSQSEGRFEARSPGDAPATSPDESKIPSTAESQTLAKVSDHERSRNENVQKLKQLRRQMYDDLMATLAWVRELVTMIHLAKYSGAPASRALELVRQIAAAVDGLSSINRSASPS